MPTRRMPTIRRSEIEKDEVLYDGIKPWMRNSVREWFKRCIITTRSSITHYDEKAMESIELSGRISLGALQHASWRYDALVKLLESDENHGLDIIQVYIETATITDAYDYTSHRISPDSIDTLNNIFTQAGSKWHVVVNRKKAFIEARVDETTQSSYEELTMSTDDYADLLKRAWHDCYGRNPRPSEAYTYAVKAVEAVSWQTVTPKNSSATLGTIIADLERKEGAGKVSTLFKDKHAGTSVGMVVSNMRRLWQGHSDRHATGAYVEPTQLESEVALHLAILLCYLFINKTVAVS